MIGRRAAVGLVFAVVALGTACQPTLIPAPPPAPCYVGTFTLQTEDFTAPINTPVGPETIAFVPGGSVSLVTTNGTWTLTVDEHVTATGAFTGQASAQATATGTFTATDHTVTFVVSTLNGSAHLTGTLNGHAVNLSAQVPGSYFDELVGLHGKANYACANGGLSLSFASIHLDF